MSIFSGSAVHVHDRIALPVDAGHHVLVEAHLLEHRAAGAVDELPVDDVLERFRIDDHADVVGADIAQEIELAGPAMDPHLGDQRDEGREVAAEGDAAADRDIACRFWSLRGDGRFSQP